MENNFVYYFFLVLAIIGTIVGVIGYFWMIYVMLEEAYIAWGKETIKRLKKKIKIILR